MNFTFLINALLPILVIIAMFGLGLSLTLADFKRVVMINPKALFVGLANQLLLLPVVGFWLGSLFALSPELMVGLIIIAASPGGPASNVITNLFNGDVALSITLTTLSSLIAFVTIPLWVGLALAQFMNVDEAAAVPFVLLALQIAVITVIPTGLGIFMHNRWPSFANSTTSLVRVGSGILLIVAIGAFLADQYGNLTNLLLQAGGPTATLCVVASLLGYLTTRLFALRSTSQVTIVIETGFQNVPLALTIAVTVLDNPNFAIPAAAYGLVLIVVMAVVLIRMITPLGKPVG